MIDRALQIMIRCHLGQYDKAGKPYFLHPMAVAELLNTADDELKIIAFLHDILEDTDITEQKLRSLRFSERVISGIIALTKIKGESYSEYKQKVKSNPDAIKVKIADLSHNMDLSRLILVSEQDIKRQERYKQFYSELEQLLDNYT